MRINRVRGRGLEWGNVERKGVELFVAITGPFLAAEPILPGLELLDMASRLRLKLWSPGVLRAEAASDSFQGDQNFERIGSGGAHRAADRPYKARDLHFAVPHNILIPDGESLDF